VTRDGRGDAGEIGKVTAKLCQVFLFWVPNLIAIFLVTFANLKKLPCKSLEGICNVALTTSF
jgi:hypothetical protein